VTDVPGVAKVSIRKRSKLSNFFQAISKSKVDKVDEVDTWLENPRHTHRGRKQMGGA
jgi:hypothetical protein